MTDREYEIGRWYPHNGGPCPLPQNTRGHCMKANGDELRNLYISNMARVTWEDRIVAFCVTEYPPEEKTWQGRCWAVEYGDGKPPWLSHISSNERAALGTYTVITVDRKLAKIVWEADQ